MEVKLEGSLEGGASFRTGLVPLPRSYWTHLLLHVGLGLSSALGWFAAVDTYCVSLEILSSILRDVLFGLDVRLLMKLSCNWSGQSDVIIMRNLKKIRIITR